MIDKRELSESCKSFIQELKINNISEKTLINYRSILKNMNPLFVWTKEDINNYLEKLDLKESSKQIHKIVLKKYFTWLGKPDIVSHLKIKIETPSLQRKDILTVEDVDNLIKATESTLYKALIAFLFESGARINEALAIKVRDIQETDKGMIISVPQTKTGNGHRRSLYPFSSGYIRNHISYCALSKDDDLFGRDDCSIREMLTKVAEKAGIDKPVTPHKFRHAQATDMVLREYQESIIRKKMGWTGDSKMIARYQHIIDDDVINATAEKAGKDIPKPVISNLKQAESLKIADASLQLSKLSEENEALKQGYDELKAQMELITAALQAKQQG